MRKTRLFLNIAFLGTILPSCSVGGVHESDSVSVFSSLSSGDVSVLADSTTSSSRSSRERFPFPTSYTVSIYQSFYLKRGDDGEPVFGSPRFDFSVTVEAGHPLYSTREEYDDLIKMCNPVHHSIGGMYAVVGFFSDETCKRAINNTFYSDTKVYYYCDD